VLDRANALRAFAVTLAACAAFAAAPGQAAQLMLSTTADATLGGLGFRDGDIVIYDDVLGTATLFFNEDVFVGNESIDSFQPLGNGHIVLSTGGGATLGGLTFRDGDAVDYDPVNDVATLLFSEDLFLSGANLDGFQLLPNGHFLISTTDNETVGGVAFEDGDIVDYDPINDVATIFLSENDVFTSNSDIGGFHVMDDGRVAFSTLGTATLDIAGLTMLNGDIVLFDPNDGSASLIFQESAFGADTDVDGVFVVTLVPEPGTGALAGLGLTALAAGARSRRRRTPR
jgi:hypothetical protein